MLMIEVINMADNHFLPTDEEMQQGISENSVNQKIVKNFKI